MNHSIPGDTLAADAGGASQDFSEMRVAIVHYWLINLRGGEKVVEALCEMFPQAVIYTHVYCPERMSARINRHSVKTSFISKLPFAKTAYQKYLPLMPLALEQLDLPDMAS